MNQSTEASSKNVRKSRLRPSTQTTPPAFWLCSSRILLWLLVASVPLRADVNVVPSATVTPKTSLTTNEVVCAPGVVAAKNLQPVIQPAGTRRMIERLDQIRSQSLARPEESAYWSAELVKFFRREMARATNAPDFMDARLQLAINLLRAGESEAAVREFESFEQDAPKAGAKIDERMRSQLRVLRALCHLRIGEQENCLTNHTSESCLVPIREAGVHKLSRGSKGAVALLTEQLEKYPKDLKAAWLLNLGYMTLGEYPAKVPQQWLIPPKVFAAEYDIKRFPDVAGAVGLDVDGLAGGTILEDFDGDGLLDVMISEWNLTGQLRLFRNNGDGTFTERTAQAGLLGIVSGLNLMQTDYNNDGHPDVFIPRGAWLSSAGHHPKSLLRNNGDGTFEDVTEQAGLLSLHPTQTAVWFDFDGDGWLDVFIGHESTDGDVHRCELYRNNRDGTFSECGAESGVAVTRFVKGVASGDFNNDGRPDLYLSTRGGPNLLFRNDGPEDSNGLSNAKWRFTDVAVEAGVTSQVNTFPTWFFDYDNDGWQDIFVSGYMTRGVAEVAADYLGLPHRAERARLYRNKGDGTFADVTTSVGLYKVLLAMGANYGDLDNDGWLDFYVGTGDPDFSTLVPNRMFRNNGGRYFQEVTASAGVGHIQKGHGVSFGDLDNDGDQDIYHKVGGAYSGDTYRSALFLNPGHGNRWLTLKLQGVRSNRPAIGARIKVIVETAEGDRSIYKTVSTGGSFGASPFRQGIGLGQAKGIRSVEIVWPATGQTQILKGLEMDRFYTVREGDASAVVWKLPSFQIRAGAGHVGHHPPQQANVAK